MNQETNLATFLLTMKYWLILEKNVRIYFIQKESKFILCTYVFLSDNMYFVDINLSVCESRFSLNAVPVIYYPINIEITVPKFCFGTLS